MMVKTMPLPALETSAPSQPDTRSRILTAAQRLFRKRGYHATGLNDILDLANAPKGSMYHHFPGGKEAIGVCVIEDIAQALLGLLEQSRARSTEALVLQVGESLSVTMEKTDYEICTLFSAFAAERKSSPQLRVAVAKAYESLVGAIAARLQLDGLTARAALEKALMVTALLEGGSLLSQAQQSSTAFRLSYKQAASLCAIN